MQPRPLTPDEEARYGATLDAALRRMREDRVDAEVGAPASDAPWWIAVANTNCERRATMGLRDRGFEVWVPLQWREVRTTHKVRHPNACRFFKAAPGYVFTRHTNPNAWPDMIGVDGVRAIRCVDYVPQHVSAAEVTRWRTRLAPAFTPIEDSYRVGERYTITQGPLAGHSGPLARILDSGGVDVAVELFGRSVAVRVARENVRAA